MSALARAFGVSVESWERARVADLRGAALTAVGAWIVMAWNRFGLQGLAAPRVGVRFVLIGFYAWVGLAVVVWLLGRWADPRSPDDVPVGLHRLVQVTGLAHLPLVVVALALQVIGLIGPNTGLGVLIAALGLGIWMPAMLASAVSWAYRQPIRRAYLLAVVPYLLWLAVAGRFLLAQVGHLL